MFLAGFRGHSGSTGPGEGSEARPSLTSCPRTLRSSPSRPKPSISRLSALVSASPLSLFQAHLGLRHPYPQAQTSLALYTDQGESYTANRALSPQTLSLLLPLETLPGQKVKHVLYDLRWSGKGLSTHTAVERGGSVSSTPAEGPGLTGIQPVQYLAVRILDSVGLVWLLPGWRTRVSS